MMFDHPDFDDHEEFVVASDPTAGLRAIVAIHSTALGPAGGGIRMYPYASVSEATTDVLRLSRGMSYKMAIAGLPNGGAKSVIIADPKTDKTEALFLAFGEMVERLAPRYICGEDVGTAPGDMEIISRRTKQVLGLPGKSGDPSPTTARTVAVSMKTAVAHHLGRDLSDVTIAVQGVGHVGRPLCEILAATGAALIVADVDKRASSWAADSLGAKVIDVTDIHRAPADVFAPCAMGGSLNRLTIGELAASVVCGSANNQLQTADDAQRLASRGILYVPDYVANVGGVHSAMSELEGYDKDLDTAVAAVGIRVEQLLELAAQEGITPSAAADQTARDLIAV